MESHAEFSSDRCTSVRGRLLAKVNDFQSLIHEVLGSFTKRISLNISTDCQIGFS